MKAFTAITLAASMLVNAAHGHYIFQFLTANGVKGGQYQNIRRNTNYNSPVTDLSSPDLRCNVGGASGSSTSTVSIAAGSTVTFTSDTAVYHQGPISFYMTKVANAATADGSTPWFKIADISVSSSGQWPMRNTYDVQIPSCIAAGEYLLRIQQLGIHNPGSPPQFYISCAQVKVTGGGSTNFNGVSIPGAFKSSDPGYTANIYNNFNPATYQVPGPAVSRC
ncbi:lytic polysaccharide monooxygenase [Patellaria atrata CBS 101060]|uniref:AA9 family lytic polysaccharide monooxygenase n=1 Tax=Patellaria atrata CBS 101060 TaxID=1346257 RepID=A0A9P4S1F3_9PEZI|nr:lytic polysaccharide monooxygenase [Patellaria atrata CBS 101060]